MPVIDMPFYEREGEQESERARERERERKRESGRERMYQRDLVDLLERDLSDHLRASCFGTFLDPCYFFEKVHRGRLLPQGVGFRVYESGSLRAVHLSRHTWPWRLVN